MLAPLLPSRWGPPQHPNSAVGFLEAGRSVLPEPPIPAMNGECVFSQGAGPCRCGPPCLTCERGRGPSVGAARGGDAHAQSPRAQDHGRRARPHRNASVTSLKRDFGSHSFMGTMSASQSYQVGKLRHRGLPRLPTAAGAGCGAQRGAGPHAWDSVLLLPVPRPPPSSSPVTPGLLRRARLRPLAHLDTAPPTVTQSLHHIYAQDGGQGGRARRLGSWPEPRGRRPGRAARPSTLPGGASWSRALLPPGRPAVGQTLV